MTIPISASNFSPFDGPKPACDACSTNDALDFRSSYAFQPTVDVLSRTVCAHEAVVRGLNGEGAGAALARVTDANRYRFDPACRVKAIEGAAHIGISERLSSNFLPNAMCKPEVCNRTTLEAVRASSFPRSSASSLRRPRARSSRTASGWRTSCASTGEPPT